jgi:hypothetical protein
MQRLVVALTTLLTLVGVVVIGGYLLLFSASRDRAAGAAPPDTAIYLTAYLQPSTGQRLNLADVLGTIPGFADAANLEEKLHELAQRLLGDAGLDYEADVRPWLGNQVSLAISFEASGTTPSRVVALVGVKDPSEARSALERILAGRGVSSTVRPYQGVDVVETGSAAFAVLEDLLVIGDSPGAVEAALDADAGRSASLADVSAFGSAMRRLPADHLGAAYIDLRRVGAIGPALGGYATAGLALVVDRAAIRIAGTAPFDEAQASELGRQQFALSSEPSSLADWMPADAEAEVVVFGLQQTLAILEGEVAAAPDLQAAEDAVNQLRALAALGLGINLDGDVLPLFNREVALGARGLGSADAAAWLLLRPADAAAAEVALGRMRDALAERGAEVEAVVRDGVTITTLRVPDLGELTYAMSEGVIIAGLDTSDVEAVLAARAAGQTLAATDGYRRAWEAAGARAGNEMYLDIGALADLLADTTALPDDGRDILHAIGALAITAPAHDNATEFHLVLTTR